MYIIRCKWCRLAILVTLVVASIALLVVVYSQQTSKQARIGTTDFIQYWAAAKLLIEGKNPYDSIAMVEVEQTIDSVRTEPILMWNPPWTLVLALPFALLPFGIASWFWLVVNVALALTCGMLLWHMYLRGRNLRIWLGALCTACFMPVLQAIQMGQISLWLLVGVTGFLVAIREKRFYLAGAALFFLTIKPHVVLIFIAAVVWWILREKKWRILVGGVAALFAASVVVGLISPAVFSQYLHAAASPPLYWRSASMGTWLRTLFGADKQWLQFLPTVIGLAGFIVWALRYKDNWEWPSLVPGLLLASTISSAYGWGFDQVTLIPAAVTLILGLKYLQPRQRILLLGLYVLAQAVLLLETQLLVDSSVEYWFPLVLVSLYVWQKRMLRSTKTRPPGMIQA